MGRLPRASGPVYPRTMEAVPPDLPDLPATVLDPAALVDLLLRVVQDRNYAAGAGVLLLLCVYVVKQRWQEIPAALLPAVSLALASVPALALTLLRPEVSREEIWRQVGLLVLVSGGAWSSLGKWVLPRAHARALTLLGRVPVAPPPADPPQ